MLRTLFNLDPLESISDFDIYLRHSWVWVVVLVAGAIGFAVQMYRSETELTPGRRKVMGACQALAAFLLILMLAEPVLKMTITRPLQRTVLVLLDTSASMSIPADPRETSAVLEAAKVLQKVGFSEEASPARTASLRKEIAGASRLDLARATVTHPEIDLVGKLAGEYKLRFFSFDDQLQPLAGEGETMDWLAQREADGETSRVGSAIEEAVGRHTGQPIAGVVVLSDFISIKGRDPVDVAQRLGERKVPVPVYTVAIGQPDPPDIKVVKLIAPEVVFTGDEVPLRIQIDSSGFDDQTVELQFSIDGQAISSRNLVLSGDTQFEEMMFKPQKKGGVAALKVAIEDRAGETSTENNSVRHDVRIIDEKIKILYVEGLPRWEYRYLRWVLLRDRRLEVKFLMTEGDPSLAAASPQYVASFPDAAEEILKHDLIIIGDVPASYFNSKQVTLIDELVKNSGGCVLMLAGPLNAPASYVDSPLARMLPVKIGRGPAESAGAKVYPVVTPEGQESSVSSLAGSRQANARLWSRVQPLGFLPQLDGAKPGAEILLSLPKLDSDAAAYPLLAWQRYGKGKTMYVGSEDLWRLRREEGDRFHARFWGQAIQFLTLSRLLGDNKQVTLETSRKSYASGDQVNVFANVLTESFEPVDQPVYHVLWEKKDAASVPVDLELARVPGSEGFYSGSFLAEDEGAFVLRALPKDQEKANTVVFNVRRVPLEQREMGARLDVAEQVAKHSGGRHYALSGLAGLPEALHSEASLTTVIHREKDMWDLPAIFVLLVVVTGIEWYMRRRDNLV
jgi:uncharacterized membrane protein